ncbi:MULTISPECIES: hypothetical protein [unclassified Streptomyces]|uniref:hypothetical protein n=1 Tax=unclassified Streptomyces TaxID=2593676 RepID=UPI000B596E0D|nr:MULTISPECIES: hypothetical protein [unclassified Streptomyces]
MGFDIGLAAVILLTAVLAHRRHRQVNLAAVAVTTMLVVDAWFDVMTTPREEAGGILVALATACLIELPLAVLSLWIALTAGDLTGTAQPHLRPPGPEDRAHRDPPSDSPDRTD